MFHEQEDWGLRRIWTRLLTNIVALLLQSYSTELEEGIFFPGVWGRWLQVATPTPDIFPTPTPGRPRRSSSYMRFISTIYGCRLQPLIFTDTKPNWGPLSNWLKPKVGSSKFFPHYSEHFHCLGSKISGQKTGWEIIFRAKTMKKCRWNKFFFK